ncbi:MULTISPECIES: DUF2147 domain-containing protein [Novosphingobium]|uniref:DUF2147 domain-containing protein n=1 Tax=Novosphingobium mangrovi (ex Hu et al. 2023) TaxID=2930094 RepID=A0ABT0ABE4_9SPHN|nr:MULTISPECIES: DUF2147 domain-containing protein [Novosphingobium]MCJ1960520.1 DUF2147 domain-containing protein [Novosphingobium mangrovi (ex Hu et al. 2023)]
MHTSKSALLALAAGLGLAAPAQAASADSALGTWRTPSKNGTIEISRCGASICGRLVSSDNLKKNPNLRDVNNKDEAKRDRKLMGLQIIGGFEKDGDKWEKGSIYNPEDGGTYKATISLEGPDTLKLKGCIVWPLCKTQTWTRID